MGIGVINRTVDWSRDGEAGIWGGDVVGKGWGGAGPRVLVGTGTHGLGQGIWGERAGTPGRGPRGVTGAS